MSLFLSMQSLCKWGYTAGRDVVGKRRLSVMVALTLLLAMAVLATVFRSYHSPGTQLMSTNSNTASNDISPVDIAEQQRLVEPSRKPSPPPSARPTRTPTFLPTIFPPEPIDEKPLHELLKILSRPPYYLPKLTIQNASQRVLFVAGLEGTGHHSISSLLATCLEEGRCRTMEEVSLALFSKHGDSGLFASHKNNFLYSDNFYNYFQRTLLSAAPNVTQAEGQHLYVLGLDQPSDAGMMSYPNFGRGMKVLNSPDLPPLAFLFDHVAKLDFRIIVLLRDADSILRSVYARGIGGEAEARILVNQAGLLHSQLTLLDPQYFVCVYPKTIEDLSMRNKHSLHEFIHPSISAEEWKGMENAMQESRKEYLKQKQQRAASDSNLHLRTASISFSQFDRIRLDLYIQHTQRLCQKHGRLIE